MVKSVFDKVVALVGLVVLSPVLLLVAIVVKCGSHGPAFLKQPRVGRNQKVFHCFKFRTMYSDTEDVATHLAPKCAITKAGHFLRRTRVDELPQLVNVLLGSMSLVGPRPCLPSQGDLIEAREALGVYDVSPGMTGAAQVQGVDMSTPQRLAEIDSMYVRNQTFFGDISLIFFTIFPIRSKDAVPPPPPKKTQPILLSPFADREEHPHETIPF